MRRPIVLALLGLCLVMGGLSPGHGVTVTIIAPPTGGSTLFFDDFTSGGQFLSNWNGYTIIAQQNNTIQGGFMYSTLMRNALVTNLASPFDEIIANNTGSMTQTVLNGTQFLQMSVKTIPMNFTNMILQSSAGGTPSSAIVLAHVYWGLEPSVGNGNGIYWELWESNRLLSLFDSHFPATRTMITMDVCAPGGAGNCFLTHSDTGILYTGLGSGTINLASMHVFTIQMQMSNTNGTMDNYARWQVDNNAWQMVTQSACGCIRNSNSATSTIKLYPFMRLQIELSGAGLAPPFVLSQSLASVTDWVLVTNYQPASLPSGQVLSSGANPPTTQLPLGVNTFSITNMIQFQANNFAHGNVYAGGMMLFGIFAFVWIGIAATVTKKTGADLSRFGFLTTMGMVGLTFFLFYCQVLPIFMPFIVTVVAISEFFLFARHGTASGGPVPD